MREKREFTVLLSVYKGEKKEYLIQSIKSIINQSVYPDEIIVVEDGPLTQELYLELDKLQFNYPNLIKRISLTKNMGLGLALNEGIKASSNELIARMDTDDIAKYERFEEQLKIFDNNKDIHIVGSNIEEFANSTREIIGKRMVPEYHEEILAFSKRRAPFNHPSVMYKKSNVLEVGGYRDFRRGQDYELFLRMLQRGCIGYNIQKPLLYFRADSSNLNRRKEWINIKNEVYLRYVFYRSGYIGLLDFLIMTLGFSVIFIMPSAFFKYINRKLLRS